MNEIGLSQGYVALVDDEDFKRVSQFKWHARVVRRKDGSVRTVYVGRMTRRKDGSRIGHKLHRFILGVTTPEVEVDHKDGDGLNCQRHNLRKATHAENQQNQLLHRNNTSGFKGVYLHKESGKYKAQITVNGKQIHLGYFTAATEASDVRDAAALKYHGEFALTTTMLEERAA